MKYISLVSLLIFMLTELNTTCMLRVLHSSRTHLIRARLYSMKNNDLFISERIIALEQQVESHKKMIQEQQHELAQLKHCTMDKKNNNLHNISYENLMPLAPAETYIEEYNMHHGNTTH